MSQVYDFIWSTRELEKFEELFIKKPLREFPDKIFSTILFYRQSKLSEEDKREGYPQIAQSWRELYFPKIRSLEQHIISEYARKLGSFDPPTYTGKPVPSRLYAVYFNNTPIDLKKAEKDAVQVMVNDIFSHGEVQGSLSGKLFSAFSNQKNYFVHIENDDKSWREEKTGLDPPSFVWTSLEKEGITPVILETRGGYHILIEKKVFVGDVYKRVMKDIILASGGFTEVKSHGVMPIAGTIQFGFKVRFWNLP